MFKNRASLAARPAGRRFLVVLTCIAAFASVVATAGAVHWPFYGGDAGRSGYQPVEEPTTPIAFQYQKGDDAMEVNDKSIQNSIVTTTGTPETQRFAYGTEGAAAFAGNVHLQILATGAPVGSENGILVDDGADDADTFRPTGTIASQCPGGPANVGTNLESAGIAFADSSTAAGLGQLYVVHNDDNQDGTNDVAVAVIDEAGGGIQDFALATTDGFTVFSSPVLTAAQADDPATPNVNETGNRVLFFVACRGAVADDPLTLPNEALPYEVRLFRVAITNNAATVNATLGTPTSVVIPNGNPVASPALVNITDPDVNGGAPVGYVAVSAGGTGPTVQTFRQDTLAAGPVSGDLGDDGQTPSVAVQGTGVPAPSSGEIYVAVGQTPSGGNAGTTNTLTRAYRLTYNTTTNAFVFDATTGQSPLLNGTPAPALAVHEEAGQDNGEVVVTTSQNLFVLDAEDLRTGERLYFTDAPAAGEGFKRTTAAVSGDLAFVSTDNGRQLVIRLSDADIVGASEFTQNANNNTATFSTGQPSISRRFVQYQSDQGAFVYLGTGPQFAINDVERVEGDSGTRVARFTITRTGSTADSQTVTVRTTNGPAPAATAGQDYQAIDTTVTFLPGESSRTVDVTINSDTTEEPDERFTVTLSGATGGATIADDTGIGTILDDDDVAPQATTFSIGDASVTEGDAGATQATFTITKSGPGAASVTVNTANGTATAPGDYTARTNVVVAFTAEETTKTFTVGVNGDTSVENDETFTVNLSAPTGGATISDGSGTGLIADDDEPVQPVEPDPTVSVSDNSAGEGDAGTSTLTFTVSLSRPAEKATSVNYATSPGSAGTPGDFTTTSGTVQFAVGEQSKTVTVALVGDLVDEGDETFKITLSSPSNATLGDAEGTGTVVDDDRALVSVNDASITEGDISAVTMTFAVYLSTPSASEISVAYATGGGNATAGQDYTSATGTIRFAPGETTKNVTVSVLGDRTEEATERFLLTLSSPVNVGLLKASGVGTIADDEAAPRVDPRGLSARTTPTRDRTQPFTFTTTGRVLLPEGLTAEQACNVGRVSVTFKVVRKTISTRRANLNDDCTFRTRVTLDKRSRLGRGVLRVEVRWLGNGDLRPLGPKRYSVRAG